MWMANLLMGSLEWLWGITFLFRFLLLFFFLSSRCSRGNVLLRMISGEEQQQKKHTQNLFNIAVQADDDRTDEVWARVGITPRKRPLLREVPMLQREHQQMLVFVNGHTSSSSCLDDIYIYLYIFVNRNVWLKWTTILLRLSCLWI